MPLFQNYHSVKDAAPQCTRPARLHGWMIPRGAERASNHDARRFASSFPGLFKHGNLCSWYDGTHEVLTHRLLTGHATRIAQKMRNFTLAE
jgi:hypothetical protein